MIKDVHRQRPASFAEAYGPNEKHVSDLVRRSGMRLTRPRLALASLLFSKGNRHVTPTMIHAEAQAAGIRTSIATVYNVLNRFAEVGLLRCFSVEGTQMIFDTNVSPHQHLFFEDSADLSDVVLTNFVPAISLSTSPPAGYDVARVEVIIRLRRIKPAVGQQAHETAA
jgi:Fur family iron response transcriptional regulator